MIDPRFANVGGVPFAGGYGPQPVPFQHHHHHHHRHHKNKKGAIDDSPVSRDESIHKVDHGRPPYQQNEGAPFGAGYGVPYGAAGAFYPQQQQQQQQFAGGNYGFSNQYQGNVYDQGQFGGAATGAAGVPGGKHRRHHHRHHHHAAEAASGTATVDQAQGVPEQLIGQRSSSVLGNEAPQVNSPAPAAEEQAKGEKGPHRRHRHHRHHHHHQGGEHASFGQAHQSHHGHTSAGADGYGHINDDLIFIERGEHSPHRQEPPAGYEYKGKIEVQSIDKEHRSRFQGQSTIIPPLQSSVSLPQQSVSLSQHTGPCPPGWQQMILSAAPGGPCPPGVPCPPGGAMYTGQLTAAAGIAQASLGGIGGFGGIGGGIGFGGVGPIGAAGSGGGLANLAASLPFPPQGQLVADYIVESNAGGVSSSGGSGFLNEYQQTGSAGSFAEHQHSEQVEGNVTSRATIIEVWQKRSKGEVHQQSPPHSHSHSHSHSRSRSPKHGHSFDFDRFRNDILGAIERMVQNSGSGAKIQWTGHDGGTQTQIHPGVGYEEKKETERRPTAGGEVRVIVQPIQPVFYMPRQTESTTTSIPHVGPGPAIQQTSGGANVVYVPRNVYVPVIKPVFVPRERIIVRPQVIHVARPVLVDRPVPVTQRPIIIDRERPVPVPLRGGGGGGGQGVTQAAASSSTKEEYVYPENLPVAYGGQFAESTGGVNYDYTTSQQEQQYATSSTQEVASGYQTQGEVINVTVPEQFQHSHSAGQLTVDQGAGSFHGSYANLAQTSSASAVDVAPLHCTAPIEVLNSTGIPSWQRADKSNLVRLYGRPAYEIVQSTGQAEQQMYQELRQQSSSGGIQRSDSAASYGSGSGIGAHSAGFGVHTSSFSSNLHGDIQNFNQEGNPHQGSVPVCVNY